MLAYAIPSSAHAVRFVAEALTGLEGAVVAHLASEAVAHPTRTHALARAVVRASVRVTEGRSGLPAPVTHALAAVAGAVAMAVVWTCGTDGTRSAFPSRDALTPVINTASVTRATVNAVRCHLLAVRPNPSDVADAEAALTSALERTVCVSTTDRFDLRDSGVARIDKHDVVDSR